MISIPEFTINSNRKFISKFLIVPAPNFIHSPFTLISIDTCNTSVKTGSLHLWIKSFLYKRDWIALIKKNKNTTKTKPNKPEQTHSKKLQVSLFESLYWNGN